MRGGLLLVLAGALLLGAPAATAQSAPACRILSPASPVDVVAGEGVLFEAVCEDADADLAQVTWRAGDRDGAETTTNVSSASARVSFHLTFVSRGIHEIVLAATDAAGSRSANATWIVRVAPQPTPPACEAIHPAQPMLEAYAGTNVTFTVWCHDRDGDLETIQWTLDAALHQDRTLAEGGLRATVHLIAPGSHLVQAAARDAAGQWSEMVTWTVEVHPSPLAHAPAAAPHVATPPDDAAMERPPFAVIVLLAAVGLVMVLVLVIGWRG